MILPIAIFQLVVIGDQLITGNWLLGVVLSCKASILSLNLRLRLFLRQDHVLDAMYHQHVTLKVGILLGVEVAVLALKSRTVFDLSRRKKKMNKKLMTLMT